MTGQSGSRRLKRGTRFAAWSESEGSSFGGGSGESLAQAGRAVVEPVGRRGLVGSRELWSELRRAVEEHDLRLPGGGLYRQSRGIAQGSPFSLRLCDLYLARMEEKLWGDLLRDPDVRLLRQVDDLLLLSRRQEPAEAFISSLLSGRN